MNKDEEDTSLSRRRERLRVRGSETLTTRARHMRNEATDAERLLWQRLRGRQIAGYKFRRQFPIAPYIVDFICLEAMLIIELDGGQHADATAYDNVRTSTLQQRGYQVIRFWNNEVLGQTDLVLDVIAAALGGCDQTGGDA